VAVLRVATLALLAMLGLAFFVFLGAYLWIAFTMESPESAIAHAGLLRITDNQGNLISESDGQGGQRIPVSLGQVSPDLINATVAVEDASFWRNSGLNVEGIASAIYDNLAPWHGLLQGRGGSSISQQLAKNLYISTEDRTARDPLRKGEETILALELNRRYSKEQILEWYLNGIYYGNFATGIQAASLRYFSKNARDLTLPEAALLAGIPQAPALYDPLNDYERAKQRQETVLDLMARHGYLTTEQATEAKLTPLDLHPSSLPFHAAHVVALAAQFASALGVDPGSDITIQTTIDSRLQAEAEAAVSRSLTDDERAAGVDNAAVVVIDPKTGRILALVGSADYLDPAISGQVDNSQALNEPGGEMAPFMYLSAFAEGWLPSTRVKDTPYSITSGGGSLVLGNRDGWYRGNITVRDALDELLTVPTVRAWQFAGEDQTEQLARNFGLDSPDDAVRLGEGYAVGYARVSLLQLTGAYAALANGGTLAGRTDDSETTVARPFVMNQISEDGSVVWSAEPASGQVASDVNSYLITNILARAYSEREAPGFDRPAALASTITDQNRDAWAIGYTPQFAIGVWVGHSDNTPMQDLSGVDVARTIWGNVAAVAHQGLPVQPFNPPSGIQFVRDCGTTLANKSCASSDIEVAPSPRQ
jgi:membrane peptidoglycan carboxypeptidase